MAGPGFRHVHLDAVHRVGDLVFRPGCPLVGGYFHDAVVAGFLAVIGRAEPVPVGEDHDGLTDKNTGFLKEYSGLRPGEAIVLGNPQADVGGLLVVGLVGGVQQPHRTVGGLEEDRILLRALRIIGHDHGLGPFAGLGTHTAEDNAGIGVALPAPGKPGAEDIVVM